MVERLPPPARIIRLAACVIYKQRETVDWTVFVKSTLQSSNRNSVETDNETSGCPLEAALSARIRRLCPSRPPPRCYLCADDFLFASPHTSFMSPLGPPMPTAAGLLAKHGHLMRKDISKAGIFGRDFARRIHNTPKTFLTDESLKREGGRDSWQFNIGGREEKRKGLEWWSIHYAGQIPLDRLFIPISSCRGTLGSTSRGTSLELFSNE